MLIAKFDMPSALVSYKQPGAGQVEARPAKADRASAPAGQPLIRPMRQVHEDITGNN